MTAPEPGDQPEIMQDKDGKDHAKQPEGAVQGMNGVMLGKLAVIAVLMFGFAFALIPVYKQICELTGINVLTQKADGVQPVSNTQVDLSRSVTVEFDANTQGPWRFRPVTSSMNVHPGEMNTVIYEVVNTQPRKMEAQAIPSFAPKEAQKFFNKIECFCFKQQTLGPNEARQMPVVFYIDPKLPSNVKTITLSYTFFEVGGPVKAPGA